MAFIRVSKSAFVVVVCLALVGCKSDTERADEYFQSGVALLQTGDTDRAIVQFRNALEFEDAHRDTRVAMGNLYLDQNAPGAAYGQFIKVAEQFPEDVEARRILAELAFQLKNWDEYQRHGSVVVGLAPDDLRVQAIDLGLKYRTAVLDEDNLAREGLTAPAEALLAQLPESKILNDILVDSYVRDGKRNQALTRLDTLIATQPEDRQLYMRRLALLAQMQDIDGLEERLLEMVERFSDDREIQRMMLRFYLSQQRPEDAEGFLRRIADPTDEDPSLFVSLISFVTQTRGEEVARAEIQRGIDLSPHRKRFEAMLALLDFNAGNQEQAIADMEEILSDASPALEETQNIKTSLAQMLIATGNQVGARRVVEEVLAQNTSNVEALKMQAGWQLQADEVDDALANLRVALDSAPEDVQVMNLMHDAYVRLGDKDLAREYLALAVEASGNAPETSLRYARLLLSEERFLPAEDALLPALRLQPRNIELLSTVGELYLRMDDIPRATQVVETLRRIDTEDSLSVANVLQAEILNREGGVEEAMAFLEGLATSEDASTRDQLILLRAHLQVGRNDAALAIAQTLSSQNPDNLGIKQALARTQSATGDLASAEATLREITAAAPQVATQSWLQLVSIARRQGDPAKVNALIDEALAATNNAPDLLWAKASALEAAGDVDGAIAIYEDLYVQNSDSVVVANNLASLLSSYKTDEASLERAWVIARRLSNADIPALQDTYGWILFRRGQVEEALPYLESAAAGMQDPVVQAHLGFAYAALERNAEALAQMQKAVDLAGPADGRARIQEARSEIARLRPLVEN